MKKGKAHRLQELNITTIHIPRMGHTETGNLLPSFILMNRVETENGLRSSGLSLKEETEITMR